MNGTVLPQASLFLGIIPALVILYFSLKGYEGQYKEKNMFISFLIGIIAGFISVIIEQVTIGVGIFFIVLFPLLEQLFKTIFLNIRRLQEKQVTIIYGLTLGLGFGSVPLSPILRAIRKANASCFIPVGVGIFFLFNQSIISWNGGCLPGPLPIP